MELIYGIIDTQKKLILEILLTDIKHYLNCIAKIYTIEFLSMQHRALHEYVNFTTLPFRLNITLTSIFNFTILLSYHEIRVFLVQKFSCSVATHEHEPSLQIRVE